MNRPDYIPVDYNRIKVVENLEDVFVRDFKQEQANCILFPRSITGDFNGLAAGLKRQYYSGAIGVLRKIQDPFRKNIFLDKTTAPLYLERIINDPGTSEGIRNAASTVFNDIASIGHYRDGLQLRILSGMPLLDRTIYYFHDDAFGDEDGRTMCCYAGPATESLRNEDAIEKMDGSFPKMYKMKPGAHPIQFKCGDIWRQGTRHIGIDPFIHRAPKMIGVDYRLLLVM